MRTSSLLGGAVAPAGIIGNRSISRTAHADRLRDLLTQADRFGFYLVQLFEYLGKLLGRERVGRHAASQLSHNLRLSTNELGFMGFGACRLRSTGVIHSTAPHESKGRRWHRCTCPISVQGSCVATSPGERRR